MKSKMTLQPGWRMASLFVLFCGLANTVSGPLTIPTISLLGGEQ